MSVISNRHTVSLFVAGKSEAMENQRLSRITYKTHKDGSKKSDSKCVSVPRIEPASVTATAEAFQPYLLQLMETAQDGIIRSRIDAGATEISDEELSVTEILRYLDEESKGERMTKEFLETWFTANLADVLTVALADKLGLSDTPSEQEAKVVQHHINVYRAKIASLSGGKTGFDPASCDKLLKAISFADSADETAKRLIARLEKMKVTQSVDVLAL